MKQRLKSRVKNAPMVPSEFKPVPAAFRKGTENEIAPGGMLLADSTRFRGGATVKNIAGRSTRKMQLSRFVMGSSPWKPKATPERFLSTERSF
jgi:hypothetical protein